MARLSRTFFVAIGFLSGGSVVDASTREEDHRRSMCAIAGLDFGPAITKAGLQVDAATKDCVGNDKLACAVDVLDVVESAAWISAYIVAVTGECTEDAGRTCSSGIAGMVAATVAASQASAGIAANCPKAVENGGHPYIPRHKKPVSIGNCVIDSWEAAWAVARAGILINSAVIHCGAGFEKQDQCTLDALGVTSSIVASAHFILAATNDCRYGFSYGVACAHFTTKLVAALTDIHAATLVVVRKCGENPKPSDLQYYKTDHLQRRLTNATQESLLNAPLSDRERAYLAKLNLTEEDASSNPLKVLRLMKIERAAASSSKNMSVDAVVV